MDGRMVQIDFSNLSDKVNHVSYTDFALLLLGFLTARSQYVAVDGVQSERVELVPAFL